jgi:hypothetical protein
MLALSFILIFVVAFFVGAHPPLAVMVGVWGVILGLSGLVYWRDPITRHPSKLVLDAGKGTMEVYRESRYIIHREIVGSVIHAAIVEKKEERDSEGSVQRTYVPTVTYTDSDGTEQRETLGEWSSEPAAKALVAGILVWLASASYEPPHACGAIVAVRSRALGQDYQASDSYFPSNM